MINIKSIIKLSKDIAPQLNSIKSGFRITMKLDQYGYVSQLLSFNNADIPIGIETEIEMNVLLGEMEIEKFKKTASFELVSGRVLGTGYITKINKIILEKNDMLCINDINRCKEILLYAEQLENAIIFDDVYEWLY